MADILEEIKEIKKILDDNEKLSTENFVKFSTLLNENIFIKLVLQEYYKYIDELKTIKDTETGETITLSSDEGKSKKLHTFIYEIINYFPNTVISSNKGNTFFSFNEMIEDTFLYHYLQKYNILNCKSSTNTYNYNYIGTFINKSNHDDTLNIYLNIINGVITNWDDLDIHAPINAYMGRSLKFENFTLSDENKLIYSQGANEFKLKPLDLTPPKVETEQPIYAEIDTFQLELNKQKKEVEYDLPLYSALTKYFNYIETEKYNELIDVLEKLLEPNDIKIEEEINKQIKELEKLIKATNKLYDNVNKSINDNYDKINEKIEDMNDTNIDNDIDKLNKTKYINELKKLLNMDDIGKIVKNNELIDKASTEVTTLLRQISKLLKKEELISHYNMVINLKTKDEDPIYIKIEAIKTAMGKYIENKVKNDPTISPENKEKILKYLKTAGTVGKALFGITKKVTQALGLSLGIATSPIWSIFWGIYWIYNWKKKPNTVKAITNSSIFDTRQDGYETRIEKTQPTVREATEAAGVKFNAFAEPAEFLPAAAAAGVARAPRAPRALPAPPAAAGASVYDVAPEEATQTTEGLYAAMEAAHVQGAAAALQFPKASGSPTYDDVQLAAAQPQYSALPFHKGTKAVTGAEAAYMEVAAASNITVNPQTIFKSQESKYIIEKIYIKKYEEARKYYPTIVFADYALSLLDIISSVIHINIIIQPTIDTNEDLYSDIGKYFNIQLFDRNDTIKDKLKIFIDELLLYIKSKEINDILKIRDIINNLKFIPKYYTIKEVCGDCSNIDPDDMDVKPEKEEGEDVYEGDGVGSAIYEDDDAPAAPAVVVAPPPENSDLTKAYDNAHPAPDGWKKEYDDKTGKIYYVNDAGTQSKWTIAEALLFDKIAKLTDESAEAIELARTAAEEEAKLIIYKNIFKQSAGHKIIEMIYMSKFINDPKTEYTTVATYKLSVFDILDELIDLTKLKKEADDVNNKNENINSYIRTPNYLKDFVDLHEHIMIVIKDITFKYTTVYQLPARPEFNTILKILSKKKDRGELWTLKEVCGDCAHTRAYGYGLGYQLNN